MSINYDVARTHLFLQDQSLNLDDLTELENAKIFKIDQKSTFSYEKDYQAQMDLTIEYNLNQTIIARDGYTYFDILSDVGGMQSILMSFIAIFISVWNHNMLDNFLVSRLYKVKKTKSQHQKRDYDSESSDDSANLMNQKKC